MTKIKILYFLFFIATVSLAQEGLRPTTANINYLYGDLKTEPQKSNTTFQTAKTATNSLQLPFVEDFFYAQTTSYPSQLLWSDSLTYVNTGYPIAPPSIGVATFDGLNKYGFPYLPNLTNSTNSYPADTLTSKPINLKTVGSQTLQLSDSVALTFFYQARGNGENPEITDTLLVDFFDPITTKWVSNVWYKRGNTSPNTNDTIFKRAFIWVSDANYLNDGFKFRFRNKATTNGNFDHWHVDYIKLDRFRSLLGDTIYKDLTFGYVPTPILKSYSEMPWQQYIPSEMGTTQSVKIRNNDDGTTINMTYSSSVIIGTVTPTSSYNGGATNMGAFKPSGWSNYSFHSNPTFGYTISPLSDSAELKIRHVVARQNPTNDFSNRNDTVIQYQRFKNYFAYDDGTCEAGYYVLGTGGKMALKFNLNFTDTLRSVRIYFDPVGSISLAQSSYNFRINIWANGSNGPGLVLYKDSIKQPKYYNTAFNSYADYTLTTKQTLNPGTYYIGIQQQVAAGITVGFDKNLDHRQNLYYDSGTGWTQSAIYGSLMLRPVFGAKIVPPVGIKENDASINPAPELKVYPNPANEILNVEFVTLSGGEATNYIIKIINTLGQVVHQSSIASPQSSISVSNLATGIYYLLLQSNNQVLQTQKIIVQH